MIIFLVMAVAVTAAVWDFKTYRIPNWLTFGAVAVGFFINIFLGGLSGLLLSLCGLFIGGGALVPFFVMGGMGAGDVKLMAGFGALAGPLFAINILLIGSIIGGVAAAIILLRKYGFKEFFPRLFLLLKFKGSQEDSVLPYGVFISAGALLSCFWGVF
ncbi:MAG: prepilin peptidase [Firmicutes bacterium]|nr:prepilin peptidase [Bacillota bacterium]